MTQVDKVPDKLSFSRMSPEEWMNESPGIIVISRTPSGQLELYCWHYGQRLSFIPDSPEALWSWLNLFSHSHWEGLLALGLIPPSHEPLSSPLTSKRTKIALTEADLNDLFI